MITGHVKVTGVRDDKPITTLAVRVTRDDGVTAVDGTAVTYTFDLAGSSAVVEPPPGRNTPADG